MGKRMSISAPAGGEGEHGLRAGDHHGGSSVPDRFRSTSTPVPGQSAVPPEFSSTSAPPTPSPEPIGFGTQYREPVATAPSSIPTGGRTRSRSGPPSSPV